MMFLFLGGNFDNKFFDFPYKRKIELIIPEPPYMLIKGEKVTYRKYTLKDGHTVYLLESNYDELKKEIMIGRIRARYKALDNMLKKGKLPENGNVP